MRNWRTAQILSARSALKQGAAVWGLSRSARLLQALGVLDSLPRCRERASRDGVRSAPDSFLRSPGDNIFPALHPSTARDHTLASSPHHRFPLHTVFRSIRVARRALTIRI